MIVFTSTEANSLKETLDTIVDDTLGESRGKLIAFKYLDEQSMGDNYVDDLEMGGIGLASEKAEGSEMALGTIREGALTRYIARTFAIRLAVTQEAMEDAKYDEVIAATKRLSRAMYKTVEYDAANILIRAFNASFVGGDNQPLVSTAHTLPNGGTFSNSMATPMSPSRMALQIVTTQMEKLVGHDGTIEGYNPQCVICPADQRFAWNGILRATYAPEPGAFNEPNIINRDYNIDVVPVRYWSNTTTNWLVRSDNDDNINWRWRVRPSGSSWVDNDSTVMLYGIRARWARGWSDPRAVIGVNA